MKATNLMSMNEFEVVVADAKAKAVEPKTEYMFKGKLWTLLLFLNDEPFDKHLSFMRYLINGQTYAGVYTSKHGELPEPKEVLPVIIKEQAKIEQMTIFDF